MIDHVYISVTNIEKSLASVTTCSAAGRRSAQAFGCVDASSERPGSTSGLSATRMNWSTLPTRPPSKRAAPTKAEPADRTYFASGYYAANVADFDGNRLEFVHKAWNPKHS
jgi:hypothetical protein